MVTYIHCENNQLNLMLETHLETYKHLRWSFFPRTVMAEAVN